MKANTTTHCAECGVWGMAKEHIGCDTDGFGGRMQECDVCGDCYYCGKNNVGWNSAACYQCDEEYKNDRMGEEDIIKYYKAMGWLYYTLQIHYMGEWDDAESFTSWEDAVEYCTPEKMGRKPFYEWGWRIVERRGE